MDIQLDNSRAILYRIHKEVRFPDYVMGSEPMDKNAADCTPSSLFADPYRRSYPISGKSDTWLSGAYFAKTAQDDGYSESEYKATALRILKAADDYGIMDDVESAMETLSRPAQEEKRASSDYGDPESKGYPMFDREGVSLACDYFGRNAYSYGWKKRESIARNIMKKASELGVPVNDTVRQEAGSGYPRMDTMAENMLFRLKEASRRGMDKEAAHIIRITKVICTADPSEVAGNIPGLRSALSGLDESMGLDRLYGKDLMSPAALLHNVPEEDAKKYLDDAVPVGGEYLSSKALAGLPDEVYKNVLPDSIVKSMYKNNKKDEEEEEGEEKEEEGEEKEEEGEEKEEEGEEPEKDPKKVKVAIMKLSSADSNHLASSIADYLSGR